MTPEQFERLPKYAQRRIETLEANVEWWKRKAQQVESGDTNVFVWGGASENHVPLPRDSRIVFQLDSHRLDKFEVELVENELLVYATEPLSLRLASSNLAYFKLTR